MLQLCRVLGYDLIDAPADIIARDVCDSLERGASRQFAFLNPHSIVLAERNKRLRECLSPPTELLCDGVGLSLAGLILNHKRVHRVWGYSFFLAVSTELSRRRTGRVFFLGGRDDYIDSLVEKYRAEFPGLKHVAYYVPRFTVEFGEEDIVEMSERIRAARPDVLWIGVGSPKQELLMRRLQASCRVPCAAAIGAVFDLYSGRISYGPQWVNDFGLFWVYRLLQEPRRLWRRTVISGPLFLLRVFRELVSSPA